ncbi:hypothetical protein, partial [Sphingomonas melonis]|uniref:hypothetical protein n=1 Tax=Sphingomonas melonis TaxID=152682 RepID=UPI001E624C7A
MRDGIAMRWGVIPPPTGPGHQRRIFQQPRPFDAHHRQQQESWRFAALNCSITRAKNCDQKTPVAG